MGRLAHDHIGNQRSKCRAKFEGMSRAAAGQHDRPHSVDDEIAIGRHRPGMALDQLHVAWKIRHAAVEPIEEPRMFGEVGLPRRHIGRPAFLAGAEGKLVADAGYRMAIYPAKSFAIATPFANP